MNPRPRRAQSRHAGLRVLVTGATGFVGFHTALALHESGHQLRLLVRSAAKMHRLFDPLGLRCIDYVVGDISDPESVSRALEDCDAVVHAAAVVNLDASDAARTVQTNRRATELIIGGAAERGLNRIIYVSSIAALFNPGGQSIDDRSPLAMPKAGYGRSKVECDLFVRGLQASGAPVYTTYPGLIVGPDDPGLSEGMRALATQLNFRLSLATSGGAQFIDVRDLAQAHCTLIERGAPAQRYLMGGHYISWDTLADTLEELTGQRQRRLRLSPRMLTALFSLGDILNPLLSIELEMSRERAYYITGWTPSDDSRTLHDLNLRYRDLNETFSDAIISLVDAGHIKNKACAEHIRVLRRREGIG